jgi:hypothetical protein
MVGDGLLELPMKVEVEGFVVTIVETDGRRRGLRCGPGWYWCEGHIPPVGIFKSPTDALRDVAPQLETGKLAAAVYEFCEALRRQGRDTPPPNQCS